MGKSMIIEAQDSSLVYEEGSQKGVLGKLSGPFMDFRNGTRNGDRLYNEELVDNRIFGNEDVMEALDTRTLFGELDHPEGDRCETLAQNAAISIIKLEKDAEKGIVDGEALILDTPCGRTLKALIDSGAKMGISSRGIGEEIISEGKTIIDPDTYDFITFDIVVTPANRCARLSLVESKQRDSKLYKSIESEIKECTSVNQLDQIKKVVESAIPLGKQKLVKLIESKVTTLEPDEDITGANSEDINKGNEDIIPNKVQEESSNKVEENVKVITSKQQIKARLNEQINITRDVMNASKTVLEENKKLLKKVEQLESSNELLQAKLEESRENERNSNIALSKLEENHKRTLAKLRKINETKISNINKAHDDEIKSLNESISKMEGKYNRLLEANKSLSKDAIECKSKLVENSRLTQQVKDLTLKLQESKNANKAKLEESKKLQESEVTKLQKQLEEANQKIAKLQESKQRLTKLPFNLSNASFVYDNGNENNLTTEDEALFNTMVEMNQK